MNQISTGYFTFVSNWEWFERKDLNFDRGCLRPIWIQLNFGRKELVGCAAHTCGVHWAYYRSPFGPILDNNAMFVE